MPPAAALVQDVILRDGTTLRLRPPTEADGPAVLRFFAGLSRESLHSRFHGLPAITPALVQPYLDPDWEETGALMGVVQEDAREDVVALAAFSRLRDVTAAEVAFTVADAYQGRG